MQRAAMLRTAAAAICCIAFAGCTLVDQRTFNPRAGLVRTVPAPAGPEAIVPLLTIDLSAARPEYGAALSQAVNEAVSRKPDVTFEVVSVVPAAGTPAEQVATATGITADARDIARAINAAGVDDGRIHLSARADPGVSTRQVQVFVR